MESDKPYISKRPHKKSRNGCIACKQRKQKCDEVHPVCGSCKKRKAKCLYAPKSGSSSVKQSTEPADDNEEPEHSKTDLVLRRSSSSESSVDELLPSQQQVVSSFAGDENATEEILEIVQQRSLLLDIPRTLHPRPWLSQLEHQLYDNYYLTHRAGLDNPDIEPANREIWLSLVPQMALTTDRTLLSLLLSLGAFHSATKSPDYPALLPGTEARKLFNISMHYFSEAINNFRNSITSKNMYETNPEVFCVTALILSVRSSNNALHHHTDAEVLYGDMLSWWSATLGYIALGGFYTERLENTRLGGIIKENPSATYQFYPFLEFIRAQDVPVFDYLHPLKDTTTQHIDQDDLTEESLESYTMAIKLIGWVYGAAIGGASPAHLNGMYYTVPYTVDNHFLELLRKRRPRAIAILAHHTALLAFLGVYERMHFWPREHITLFATLVSADWSWAFNKALDIVAAAENTRNVSEAVMVLSPKVAS